MSADQNIEPSSRSTRPSGEATWRRSSRSSPTTFGVGLARTSPIRKASSFRNRSAADGRARCETLRNAVSQENVELVRRLYAELASEGSTQEFEQRMSDDALGRFLDPEVSRSR